MSQKRISSLPYHNLINFIPENGPDVDSRKNVTINTQKQDESHGHEVRSFYETLISEESFTISKKVQAASDQHKPIKNLFNAIGKRSATGARKTRSHSVLKFANSQPSSSSVTDTKNNSSGSEIFNQKNILPKQRQHFKLLKYAQLGDEENVKDLLDKGLDVDFIDFYGWTALMCAAKEGNLTVIETLLKYGANRLLHNSSSDTALTLARKAGHLAVVSILESCDVRITDDALVKDKRNTGNYNSSSEVFHCSTCKRDFSQDEAANHQTSTVHLFNSGHRSKCPAYFIPDSNRGFKMLLRSGWDIQRGLGPEGKGRKYPIKTVFKQDRAGLGDEDVKRKKAKVTHFDRGDTEAVKYQNNTSTRQISVRKSARNAARSKERKNRRWEQNLRYEMS